jgi:hypothetical protein
MDLCGGEVRSLCVAKLHLLARETGVGRGGKPDGFALLRR